VVKFVLCCLFRYFGDRGVDFPWCCGLWRRRCVRLRASWCVFSGRFGAFATLAWDPFFRVPVLLYSREVSVGAARAAAERDENGGCPQRAD